VSSSVCHTTEDWLLQARKQLAGFPKDKKKYEALLTDLLVQALVKLKQPAVIVKGREVILKWFTGDNASPAC
jgi:ATP synthase (E/31 kDa) subunit